MQAPDTLAQRAKHWLYDWNGGNVDLLLALQRGLPEDWVWLPEVLSALGSYWGAPAVVVLLLGWRRMQIEKGAVPLVVPLYTFVVAVALAIATAALAKAMFALPRPFVVLGDAVYRAASTPDSRYTMPSGHSVYVGAVVAALWPVFGWPGRMGLLLFATLVGWSRIVLGAHFPADVVAGLALGWMCVAAVAPCAWIVRPLQLTRRAVKAVEHLSLRLPPSEQNSPNPK